MAAIFDGLRRGLGNASVTPRFCVEFLMLLLITIMDYLSLFDQFSGSHHISNLDPALGPAIVIQIVVMLSAIAARHE